MTRKKAKKELMGIGFDRNAAELWIKWRKRYGIRENREVMIEGILALLEFYEKCEKLEGCKPEELGLATLHAKGNRILIGVNKNRGMENAGT